MTTNHTDEQIISKWEELISKFKKLTDDNPSIEKIKKELLEIQQDAKNSSILTTRQISGVYDRCQNYLNGSYGRNLSHVK